MNPLSRTPVLPRCEPICAVTSAPLTLGQKFQCVAGSVDVESMVSILRLSISAPQRSSPVCDQ